MSKTVWLVNRETAGNRRQKPPYAALLMLVDRGKLVDSREYSEDELQAEITKRQRLGEDVSAYVEAYAALRRANGTG